MFPLQLDTVLTLVRFRPNKVWRPCPRVRGAPRPGRNCGCARRPGSSGAERAGGAGPGPEPGGAREARLSPPRTLLGWRPLAWGTGAGGRSGAERAGCPDPAGARLRRAEPGRRRGGRPPSLRRRLARAVAPRDVRGAARPAGRGTARGEPRTVTRREDTGEGSAVQPRPGLGGWTASGALRSEARAPAPGSCRGRRTRGVGEGRGPGGRAGAGACFPGDPTVFPQLHPLWLGTRHQGLKILPEAPERNQIALSRAQSIGDSAVAPGRREA